MNFKTFIAIYGKYEPTFYIFNGFDVLNYKFGKQNLMRVDGKVPEKAIILKNIFYVFKIY